MIIKSHFQKELFKTEAQESHDKKNTFNTTSKKPNNCAKKWEKDQKFLQIKYTNGTCKDARPR